MRQAEHTDKTVNKKVCSVCTREDVPGEADGIPLLIVQDDGAHPGPVRW
jgi:hypothetical protein